MRTFQVVTLAVVAGTVGVLLFGGWAYAPRNAAAADVPKARESDEDVGETKAKNERRDRSSVGESSAQEIISFTLNAETALARLKILRIQMALDREEIAALKLRLQKIMLQKDLQQAIESRPARSRVRGSRGGAKTEPSLTGALGDDIIVKAISLRPVKEAVVLYRGRVYHVRQGDNLGDLEVADIVAGGISFRSRGGQSRRIGVGAGVR